MSDATRGEELRLLGQHAKAVSRHARCGYSGFRVGAAVLLVDSRVLVGVNVENASYGLTMCAERVALFNACTLGQNEIVAIGIYTPTESPTFPCGACRQVMLELAPSAELILFCDGASVLRRRVTELLPDAFRL